MTQPPNPSVREVLLQVIHEQSPKRPADSNLQQGSILDASARKLPGVDQQAILTQWHELFRTGLLAWGFNLSNPNPPWCHLTDRGRKALESLTRDPSNPDGYMRHLASMAKVGDIAMSYLKEGLECYVGGHFKAAAVMTGAAAESIILDLRDAIVGKLKALGQTPSKQMEDWRIKIVTDEIGDFFLKRGKAQLGDLWEPLNAYWAAFALQIRAVRNDAGHPASIDPVTPETIHASLLVFPELARLAHRLTEWVKTKLT